MSVFEPCPTCAGTTIAGHFEHVNPDTGEHLGNEPVECPACVRGRVVSESVIEEMARAMAASMDDYWDEPMTEIQFEYLAMARAASRVVLEHMKDNERTTG